MLHCLHHVSASHQSAPNSCLLLCYGYLFLYLFLQSVDFAVDGFRRCEKWQRQDMVESKETRTSSWLNRFIGRAKKPEMTWPFPFSEGKMFVLTIQAGVEGYHINVGGRHVASFPHRMVTFLLWQRVFSSLWGCGENQWALFLLSIFIRDLLLKMWQV